MHTDNPAIPAPPTTITLSGMSFHARIGVLPHEREIAQPLEVDLTVLVGEGTGVVDYRGLYAAVRDAAAVQPIDYLEDIAEGIATRVLGHERVLQAQVTVRKPQAAVGGPLRFAQVAIVRQRHA